MSTEEIMKYLDRNFNDGDVYLMLSLMINAFIEEDKREKFLEDNKELMGRII